MRRFSNRFKAQIALIHPTWMWVGLVVLVWGQTAQAADWAEGYPKFTISDRPSTDTVVISADPDDIEFGQIGVELLAQNVSSTVDLEIAGLTRFTLTDQTADEVLAFGGGTTTTADADSIDYPITALDYNSAAQQRVIVNMYDNSLTDSEVAISKTMTLYIDGTAPPFPTGLSAEIGENAVTLEWDALRADLTDTITDVQNNISNYRIYYSKVDFSALLTAVVEESATSVPATVLQAESTITLEEYAFGGSEGTSYKVDGLSNGTTYYFVITTIDHVGNESGIEVIDGTPTVISARPEEFQSAGEIFSEGYNGTCFVVTASLGDRNSLAVRPYYWVRDNLLVRTGWGQQFVDW